MKVHTVQAVLTGHVVHRSCCAPLSCERTYALTAYKAHVSCVVLADVAGEPVSAACGPERGGCASAGAAPLPARPRPCRPRLCCAQAASAREDAAARLLQGLGRIAKGAGPAAQPTAAPAAAPPLLPSSASAFHSVSSPQ